MGTVDTIIDSINSLLSSQPFSSTETETEGGGTPKGWAHLVYLVLYKRLQSGPALIQDFQDLIKGCEKKIYYSLVDEGGGGGGGGLGGGVGGEEVHVQVVSLPPPQGTYVEMQTESLQSIGCHIGKRLLRMLAAREWTRRLEADLTDWIVDTEKWVDSGMKEVKKEETKLAKEGWIYESDAFFWQDDLYRPMQ